MMRLSGSADDRCAPRRCGRLGGLGFLWRSFPGHGAQCTQPGRQTARESPAGSQYCPGFSGVPAIP